VQPRGMKHTLDDELDEITVDVDDAISELEVTVEMDDDARFTGTTFCDVVLVVAPLFVPRYMTRPIITTIATTTAATTAAATPARDSSNFNLLTAC